jgi:DNA-binding PadR family transcriptional regulator
MDHHALLLLGLLKNQAQHGYQLNDFIEKNLTRVTDLKKPTAYALLERLRESGLVEAKLEQEGNRPPRKVYALTQTGETEFLELLRVELCRAETISSPESAALMFMSELELPERIKCLETRLGQLKIHIVNLGQVPVHKSAVNLALERQLVLLKADHDWLEQVLNNLKSNQKSRGSKRIANSK